MAELNEKLITYGNLSTFHDNLINDATGTTGATWSSKKISDMLPTAIHTTATGVMEMISDSPIANITDMDFSPLNAVVKAGKYDVIIDGTLSNGGMTVSMQFPAILEVSDMNGGGFIKLLFIQCLGDTKFIGSLQQVGQPEESIEWNQSSLSHVKIDDSDTYHGGMVEKTYSSTKINQLLAAKQNTLTAGANISISGGTISATDTTYVAGDGIEISGNTISCNVEPLQAGENISVENGRINAKGYKFDSNIPSFVSNYYKVKEPFDSELEPSTMGFEELTFTGDANATTYTVGGSSAQMFFQFFGSMPPEYLSIYGLKINDIKVFCQSFDSANSQVTLTATVSPNAAISASPLQAITSVVTVTISGSANVTTYTVTDETGEVLESLNEKLDYNLELEVENYGTFVVDSIDVTGNTITFKETLDASNAVSNALLVKFITDSNVASGEDSNAEGYKSLASGLNSHAEGENCKAISQDSHAEGQKTVASGITSHAEGYETKASGHYSHAEGNVTKTSNIAEHAEGFNNVSHNLGNKTYLTTLSSIGIGDSLNSKNGFEMMHSGDLYIYGIGGYDGVHIKHEQGYESVKTLQEYIASLEARIAALEKPSA